MIEVPGREGRHDTSVLRRGPRSTQLGDTVRLLGPDLLRVVRIPIQQAVPVVRRDIHLLG